MSEQKYHKGLGNSREEDQMQFIVSTKGVKIAVGNKCKKERVIMVSNKFSSVLMKTSSFDHRINMFFS